MAAQPQFALVVLSMIPFQRVHSRFLQRRSSSVSLSETTNAPFSLSLFDVHDLIYIANITIGGIQFPVQLDTGSSDLWVLPSLTPPLNAEISSTSLNLTYAIGWAQGQVAFASTDFAGITVSRQAYLNVSTAQNPALSYGAAGIIGLGFDSLSNIDTAIRRAGSSSGRTLLHNIFQGTPSDANFIAFSFQSTSNGDGVQGSFSIGEVEPRYANVTNTNKIPTWPVTAPSRWTVLLDSFVVGTQTYDVSSTVPAAPVNKAVVLLDSGTSLTYAPTDVCTAIYGGIAGARYDSALGQWSVPCDTEIDMALQIDNQMFPIHPIDVTPAALGDPNSCMGSFVPQSVSVGDGQFDWLVGDNVLRSIYTLYNFGDLGPSGDMGNPYIQMLALVNPNEASVEFHNARGGTPNANITYNVSNSGSGFTTVTLSTDAATAMVTLSKFIPAIFGIMALNALALIVLLVVGTTMLCRHRKNARTRKIPGRLSLVPMGDVSGARYSEPSEDAPHTYQPMSVALTENTLFAPPTPGFKSDPLKSGDRPNSIA